MIVDVIILTDNADTVMTCETIQSLHDSETEHEFQVITVASGRKNGGYMNASGEVFIDGPFNYNKALNKGFTYLTNEWVLISNDDVKYERKWFSNMMKVYDARPDIECFSPKDPMLYLRYFNGHFSGHQGDYFESYIVSEAFMGWSIMIKRSALDKILPLDEQFDMYYQDNDFVECLKQQGIKHALVRDSIASHLNTLFVEKPMTLEKIYKLQEDFIKFENKWK
jgi:GT2 family glycosyltransferase